MSHVSCGHFVYWNQLSRSTLFPFWAVPEGRVLKTCWDKGRDNANLPYSRTDLWPAGFSADTGKPSREAAREEVPHSTSERCKRLMTGSADYLPLPPLSAVAPCQLQERMSNILQCDKAGAKRHHEALGPSRYLHFFLKTSLHPFLKVVIGRLGFSMTSDAAPLNWWT